MTGRLEGKVAIVTGGSTGLGAAIVGLYAREGAQVVFGDIRPEPARALVETLAADGLRVDFVPTDVSQGEDVAALVAFAQDRHGRLDVMTANAGILGRAHRKSLVEIAEDEVRELFDVNFMGAWWSIRHAIPALERAGGGAITVTTSTASERGIAKAPAYAATKGAIAALVRSVAVDVYPLIRINMVAPGAMSTEIAKHAAQAKGITAAEAVAQAHNVAFADPIEMAYTHLFLASDDALQMSGQTLVVDGGASIKHP